MTTDQQDLTGMTEEQQDLVLDLNDAVRARRALGHCGYEQPTQKAVDFITMQFCAARVTAATLRAIADALEADPERAEEAVASLRRCADAHEAVGHGKLA